MKILLTTDSYYPNIDGAAIAQRNLVNGLAKQGHDVRVIAPGLSFKNKIEEDQKTKIYRTKSVKLPLYMGGSYYFSPFPFFEVGKIMKDFQPDIVHICNAFQVGTSSLIWARKLNIPVVATIHLLPENMIISLSKMKKKYYTFFKDLTWRYLLFFFDRMDLVTIPTKTGADMYKKRGFKTKIYPISNGLKTERFSPENNGDYLRKKFNLPDKKIVLYTGRINEEKNLDVLIKSIPTVIKEVDAHYIIVGGGGEYTKILTKLSKDLGVEENITFTGFLDWEDYPNIFSIADVFALPAESELQNIPTLEAAASGLPVVVVDKGAPSELANNDNGFIFQHQNSKQMAEYIIKILKDDKLREKMGRKGIELAKNHSLPYVIKEYEKLYQKILSNNF
jgi:1,2-diacylglycerol 3-alpha-glucosyltransferase